MALQYFRFRRSDGVLLGGAFTLLQPDLLTDVLTLPDGIVVDCVHQRVDLASRTLRAATAAEVDEILATLRAATAQADSRRLDVATTIAWALARTDPLWATLTNMQKRAAVRAACDDWRDLRLVIESLLT